IVQRTQEGKAIARQNADFKDGRPKKYSRVQLNHALELLETHSYKQVERLTGISVTTIYRAKLERAKTKHLRQRASSQ
ncbi:MAG: helix-turn-helix domain-containing protein, partial [Synergistaceae bacterium]|nr:helix-turn-helix domain-containing protein [Synergistaceae bacterium]